MWTQCNYSVNKCLFVFLFVMYWFTALLFDTTCLSVTLGFILMSP